MNKELNMSIQNGDYYKAGCFLISVLGGGFLWCVINYLGEEGRALGKIREICTMKNTNNYESKKDTEKLQE